MQDCNQAVRYDAKNAVAFSNRGFAYAGKGELGRAIRDYDEAIRLDPYLTGARLNVSWWRPREP
jgi:tetratricopeptide (TPR) repeat protein